MVKIIWHFLGNYFTPSPRTHDVQTLSHWILTLTLVVKLFPHWNLESCHTSWEAQDCPTLWSVVSTLRGWWFPKLFKCSRVCLPGMMKIDHSDHFVKLVSELVAHLPTDELGWMFSQMTNLKAKVVDPQIWHWFNAQRFYSLIFYGKKCSSFHSFLY